MLLHEFAHVDPHHRVRIVEQEFGERLGQLGLADARRPEEQERAQRPVRVLEPGAAAAHRGGDGLDRVGLADHARAERGLHVEQFLALALEHPLHRNARPARDHRGDVVCGHFLAQHRALRGGLRLLELLGQRRDGAVVELGHPAEIARALRLLERDARLLELLLDPGLGVDLLLLGLPARGQLGRLLFEVGQLGFEVGQPVLRRGVGLLLQRLALDLELDDAPVEILDLLGLGFDFHADAARGLVHQVDRLVGQETVGDVAVRERRRRDDRGIGDAHAVVQLVLLLEPAQDRYGVGHGRLADEHRLEAPLERRVLLDMLAVFVERGRADAVQLAARQCGLEQVGGVHGAFALARADQRVHLVDEEDDVALAGLDLVEHALEPLSNSPRYFAPAISEPMSSDISLRSFRPSGTSPLTMRSASPSAIAVLPTPGSPIRDGIVLGAPRQDLDRPADLLVAADDGIELAVARRLRQGRARTS